MANKWVYTFKEGNMTMRNLLGGKGANLAEMTEIGLPVPQGFTITTEACTQYYEDGRKINDEIMAQAMEGVAWMEKENGKKFGDLKNPLLVSVRSGARASMPGMMDTILNLGLNDDVVAAMIAGNPDPKFERFVYDSYRRFIQMFSDVVMEVGKKYFEQLIDKMKADRGVKFDVDLTAADLKELAEQFKAEYKNQLGTDFPSDPVEQLKLAIEAVFRSWDNPRANVYRRDNDIPYSWGTAVNVMPMVFGNLNDQSGTGVAFTRDPATGENKLMGEFLINAQGEDVVAGVRTPMPIAQMEQEFPEAYAEFLKVCETLENHYHDMQDMEFTVENKKLYMLQCRNGKRTAPAALKIACDLVDEGHKTPEEAVAMIDPRNLDTLLHPQFDAAALKAATPLGKGLGASPGAACGKVVFTADDAESWAERGEKVVLVRLETSPEDITGMKAAQGILTVRGGMTSHAAVVARGMGTCCVSGCGDINMDEENKKFTLAGQTFTEGSEISIDGTTGNIYAGLIPTVDASIAGEFGRVMAWADEFRTLKVRTNADTPADAKKARELGAGKIIFAYDDSIKGSLGNVNEEYELTAKVTLDEASYQSLAADKAHLNIQGVTELGEKCDWNNSTDCQWLQQDSFTKDGENYSADLKVKFSGITPDTLMDVEFVLVGTGFKGTVTFSNVVLTNLSSDKQELTKQEPTVLSDLNDESQVNLWAGETGYQYFHGGEENAAPELSYDANGRDGRLKVSLNYTSNSKESWSE